MVEPVSLTVGAVTAALVAKSVDKATDGVVDAGVSAVSKLVAWLRGKLGRGGQTALDMVVAEPDSPIWSRTFAEVIDVQAAEDPEFRAELRRSLDTLKQAGVHVGDFQQVAIGDGNVQVAGSPGASVNYVSSRPPTQPRL